jgi:hypothetical protein
MHGNEAGTETKAKTGNITNILKKRSEESSVGW